MKTVFLLPFLLLLLNACSNLPDNKTNQAFELTDIPLNTTNYTVEKSSNSKAIAEIELIDAVNGLHAEKLIKKAFGDIKGVKKEKFTNKTKLVSITYNPKQIIKSDVEKAINTLSENKYEVSKINVKNYHHISSLSLIEDNEEQNPLLDIRVSFPNIFEVFSSLLN